MVYRISFRRGDWIAAACVGCGLAAMLRPAGVANRGQPEVARQGVVENRLVFRDSGGAERMVVGEVREGVFGIVINGDGGRAERARMEVDAGGVASWRLSDGKGSVVTGSVVSEKGGAIVFLEDPARQFGRAAMELDRDRGVFCGLWGGDARRSVALEQSEDGYGLYVRDGGRARGGFLYSAGSVGWALWGVKGDAQAGVAQKQDGELDVNIPR